MIKLEISTKGFKLQVQFILFGLCNDKNMNQFLAQVFIALK